MSSVKQKKALVFFSSGIGDAVLLVPLIHELKKQNYTITGLFTSKFNCESVFEDTRLFDNIIVKKSKLKLLIYSLLFFKNFTTAYINYFAFTNFNMLCAWLFSKKILTNYTGSFFLQNNKLVHVVKPITHIHDSLQNVFLLNSTLQLNALNFSLNYIPLNTNRFNLPKLYVIAQLSSANGKAPYKNWEINNWLIVFQSFTKTHPEISIVILGDESETHLNRHFSFNTQLISLIGKTILRDVVEIIHHSKAYIGLDSGLLHIAVALNKPTFSIWGASSKVVYGYEWKGEMHRSISLNLACSPCSVWLNPNTRRVNHPMACPDFKCIKTISVQTISHELNSFLQVIL